MGSTKEADINKEMVTGVFISSTVALSFCFYAIRPRSSRVGSLDAYDCKTCRDTLPLHRISQASYRGFRSDPHFYPR